MVGVTIDDISPLAEILEALRALPERVTARIVCDYGVPYSDYNKAVSAINEYADILLTPVDSSDMAKYTLAEYVDRFRDYADCPFPHIREVGNEVNGDWLGDPIDVAGKVASAIRLPVKAKTMVTFFAQDSTTKPPYRLQDWIETYQLPRVDYVALSIYPNQWEGESPIIPITFQYLYERFPDSKLLIGECGLEGDDMPTMADKVEFLKHWYSFKPMVPNFEGGVFYWDWLTDCVPLIKPLNRVFSELLVTV